MTSGFYGGLILSIEAFSSIIKKKSDAYYSAFSEAYNSFQVKYNFWLAIFSELIRCVDKNILQEYLNQDSFVSYLGRMKLVQLLLRSYNDYHLIKC